jgi:hypothetical protein
VPEKIMLKAISKREKIIFTLTLGVILFSIVFTFLVAPLLRRGEALNKEIRIARLKLRKHLYLLSQEKEIQDKYNRFASEQNLAAQAPEAMVSSLSVLETLAKEANIRIIDIRPQTPRGSGLHKEITIDLRTEGAIGGYLSFLYSIENSLMLLDIKRFQLNAKTNSQLLEGSFSISQISPSY